MRIIVLAFVASLLLNSSTSAEIPQSSTPTSSQQAAAIVAQSVKLFTGSGAVSDVTLTEPWNGLQAPMVRQGPLSTRGKWCESLDLTFRNGTRGENVGASIVVPTGS